MLESLDAIIGKHDIWTKFASQFIKQFGLHEIVVVRDEKRDDSLALKGFREFAADAIQMGLLHDED